MICYQFEIFCVKRSTKFCDILKRMIQSNKTSVNWTSQERNILNCYLRLKKDFEIFASFKLSFFGGQKFFKYILNILLLFLFIHSCFSQLPLPVTAVRPSSFSFLSVPSYFFRQRNKTTQVGRTTAMRPYKSRIISSLISTRDFVERHDFSFECLEKHFWGFFLFLVFHIFQFGESNN